ncbi:MAG: MFS transporter [Bdellovibrio sp.]|nr:MFS transporter [Bdellovibrio sp.]
METSNTLIRQFPDIALLSSLVVFTVGYLVRPVGAVFFGLIADGRGLKKTYSLCSMLLAGATVGLCLMPPTESVGMTSIIIGYGLRLLQGLALGGAYCTTALMAYDLAPPNARSRFTSLIQITSPAGYLTAIAAVIILKLIMGAEAFAIWGWRVCFFFGIFLFYYSYKIAQGPYKEPDTIHPEKITSRVSELIHSFSHNPKWARRFFLFVFPLGCAMGLSIYISNIYQLFFLQNVLHLDPTVSKFIIAISNLITLPTFFLWGALADFKGALKVVLGGILLVLITALPGYHLMEHIAGLMRVQPTSVGVYAMEMVIVTTLIGILGIVTYAPMITLLSENLPAKNRTTLFALSYNCGFGIFGSLAHVIGSIDHEQRITNYGSIYAAMAFLGFLLIIAAIGNRLSK